jgi:type 1 glutamine amidotransferase
VIAPLAGFFRLDIKQPVAPRIMKSFRFPSFFSFALLFISAVPGLFAAKDLFPPLSGDAGRLVIYRDAILSPQKQPTVLLDGIEVGSTQSRSFFYLDRPTGNYTFAIAGETAAPVNVTLNKGKTTYVRINVHSTPVSSELYPSVVDADTAKRELASCKYAAPEASSSSTAAAPPSTSRQPLRVLLTYKGHAFDEEKFFALWDAWQKQGLLSYQRCPIPDEAARLEPSAASQYDVLVMYDMVSEISPAQQEAFIALLKNGIGVVSLHHNLAAHEKWPLWREVIGGQFLHANQTIAGKSCDASVFEHDVWLKIGIPDPKHPIVRDVEPFYILDETYGKIYHAPDIKVVLTTDRMGNDREIAWIKWFGNSPVFYFQLGHDSHAWTHPLYQKILLQGMRWAAEEAAARRAAVQTK